MKVFRFRFISHTKHTRLKNKLSNFSSAQQVEKKTEMFARRKHFFLSPKCLKKSAEIMSMSVGMFQMDQIYIISTISTVPFTHWWGNVHGSNKLQARRHQKLKP